MYHHKTSGLFSNPSRFAGKGLIWSICLSLQIFALASITSAERISIKRKIKPKIFSILISLLLIEVVQSQTLHVQGNVSTDSTAVKYASVTFVDQSDWSRKYTVITDSLGNYQLNLITDVDDDKPSVPMSFELGQNYPNPFSTETEIPYKLNQQSDASIKIYDILGQEVRIFNIGLQTNGIHGVRWDGRNIFGNRVTPGIYFYQLQTGKETLVKKMVFNAGNAHINPVSTPNFITSLEKLEKEAGTEIESGMFTVQIISSDSTNPKILPKEFNDINIQSDTTLNFFISEDTTSLKILLENQSDHSGIMVKIVELDTFVITDSAGRFNINNIDAKGYFTLSARYPYFQSEDLTIEFVSGRIITPIHLELKQLLQFWIEPAETTVSMNNLGNPDYFSFTGFSQYCMNITNEPVTVRTWLDPINLWAIVPLDNEWPYVPNPDSLPFCYYHYNWFGGNDAIIDDYRTTIQPYDTLIAPVGTEAVNKCFQEATYLFLSAISDLSNYPEYFDPAFVYGYLGGDRKPLYEKMNRSVLKKLELFRPAVVHITN